MDESRWHETTCIGGGGRGETNVPWGVSGYKDDGWAKGTRRGRRDSRGWCTGPVGCLVGGCGAGGECTGWVGFLLPFFFAREECTWPGRRNAPPRAGQRHGPVHAVPPHPLGLGGARRGGKGRGRKALPQGVVWWKTKGYGFFTGRRAIQGRAPLGAGRGPRPGTHATVRPWGRGRTGTHTTPRQGVGWRGPWRPSQKRPKGRGRRGTLG